MTDTDRPDVLARIERYYAAWLDETHARPSSRDGRYDDAAAALMEAWPTLTARLATLEAMQARAQVWYGGVSEGEIADPDGELLCALNYILHGHDQGLRHEPGADGGDA